MIVSASGFPEIPCQYFTCLQILLFNMTGLVLNLQFMQLILRVYQGSAAVDLRAHDYFSSHPININLKDKASLSFSNKSGWSDGDGDAVQGEGMEANEQVDTATHVQVDSTGTTAFGTVDITCVDSRVYLGNHVLIKSLHLYAGNKSNIIFSESFRYMNLNGRIAGSTAVKGPWRVLNNLKTVKE